MSELWTASRVAQFLGYSYDYFMRHVRYWPGVPQPIDKPGHPRWRSSDWQHWSENHAQITQNRAVA